MNRDELRSLIDVALEGGLSEADFLRLEAELSVDPAARREYYDRVLLSTLLEAEADAEKSTTPSDGAPIRLSPRMPSRRWRWAFASMTVLCAGLFAVVAWQWWIQPVAETPDLASHTAAAELTRPGISGSEQQSSGYAILSGQVDAVWDEAASVSTGGIVAPGELRLRSGVARFELFSGVTLVVEGDATFSILSPMEVSVVSGKVRARVPEPAQGFRLLTHAGEVVDLGTEFAVNVTANRSEVHVLEGEVEWHPAGLPAQRLKQGQATQMTPEGQAAFDANPQSFVGAGELQRRIMVQQQSRRERWKLSMDELSQDQRLIVQYRLATIDVAKRQLPNLVTRDVDRASEGAVVAAALASNRWGDAASALDFSPAGSRVRLHVPGEYQNLTLIAWVRINSLDRWYNSLFLTDGHEQGEPHWQIMDDGRLFFSVKKRDVWDMSKGEKDKHIFFSPPFWNTSLSGRWLMLATVYDGANRRVTHYLNGEVLSLEAIPDEYLVTAIRIGDASLGNWGLPERDQPRFAIRNLNGCLDEFNLFGAALSADEIRRLYDDGKP
ncbi:MAG: LamG-like jellyroll fold domain-containing protein [Planctomycetaceae bacterium]